MAIAVFLVASVLIAAAMAWLLLRLVQRYLPRVPLWPPVLGLPLAIGLLGLWFGFRFGQINAQVSGFLPEELAAAGTATDYAAATVTALASGGAALLGGAIGIFFAQRWRRG